jgi:hypothetical protein
MIKSKKLFNSDFQIGKVHAKRMIKAFIKYKVLASFNIHFMTNQMYCKVDTSGLVNLANDSLKQVID